MKHNYTTVMIKVMIMFVMALEVHANSIIDNTIHDRNAEKTDEYLFADNYIFNVYDWRQRNIEGGEDFKWGSFFDGAMNYNDTSYAVYNIYPSVNIEHKSHLLYRRFTPAQIGLKTGFNNSLANTKALNKALKGCNVELSLLGEEYSFDSSVYIPNNTSLRIINGTFVITNSGLIDVGNNVSINFKDVKFKLSDELDSGYLIYKWGGINIEEFLLDNCEWEGDINILLRGDENGQKIGLLRINENKVLESKISATDARIRLENVLITDSCAVNHNHIEDISGPFFWWDGGDLGVDYYDEFAPSYIYNNYFRGLDKCNEDNYHCPVLVVAKEVHFFNNIIDNFININTDSSNSTSYDAYLSCNEVYYYGNTIRNLGLNKSNTENCQIFKSKGIINSNKYSIRKYYNNVFYNDKDYIVGQGISEDNIVIGFNRYDDIFIDDIVFENNVIDNECGTISAVSTTIAGNHFLNVSFRNNRIITKKWIGSFIYQKKDETIRDTELILIDNNIFDVDSHVGLMQYLTGNVKKMIITNNYFNSDFSYNIQMCNEVSITNNKTNVLLGNIEKIINAAKSNIDEIIYAPESSATISTSLNKSGGRTFTIHNFKDFRGTVKFYGGIGPTALSFTLLFKYKGLERMFPMIIKQGEGGSIVFKSIFNSEKTYTGNSIYNLYGTSYVLQRPHGLQVSYNNNELSIYKETTDNNFDYEEGYGFRIIIKPI